MIFVCIDEADMCILQQVGLGGLEDRGDGQENGPGSHLRFGKRTDKDDEIDKTEESQGEALQE